MARAMLSRGLMHPVFLVSVGLLAVNDHILKTAGVLPLWLTGKLSDVVGLIVAPLLLAIVVGAASRRALLACHVAVGLGFAAINSDPVLARAAELLTAHGPFPWRVHCDPTDLFALPALLVSWRLTAKLVAPNRAGESIPRARQAIFAVAMLACAATSQPIDGEVGVVPVTEPAFAFDAAADGATTSIQARFVIGNRTLSAISVAIAPLKNPPTKGCTSLGDKPVHLYSLDDYDTPKSVTIEPNGVAAIELPNASGGCAVYLVGNDTIPRRLVVFDRDTYPAIDIPNRADDDSQRILSIWSSGGEFNWNSNPVLHNPPKK